MLFLLIEHVQVWVVAARSHAHIEILSVHVDIDRAKHKKDKRIAEGVYDEVVLSESLIS